MMRAIKTLGLLGVVAASAACAPALVIPAAPDAQADGTVADAPPLDVSVADRVVPFDGGPPTDLPTPQDGGGVDVPKMLDVSSDTIEPTDGPKPPTDVPGMDVPIGTDVPPPPPTDVPAPSDMPVVTDAGAACGEGMGRALMLPTDHVMGRLSGPSRLTASCANTAGPDMVYPLHVAARTGLTITTSMTSFDTVLSVRRACATMSSEFLCNDDYMGHDSRVRGVFEPGDYFVIVDEFSGMGGMGGTYTLNVESFTPAANASCVGAIPLTGMAVMGDARLGGAASTACQNGSDGPQSYYTLTVPAGRRATLTATPMGMPAWRPIIRVQNSCMATSCVSNGTAPMPGAPAVLRVENRGTTDAMYVVTVASTSSAEGGPFTFNGTIDPLPPPPTNLTCPVATRLTLPASLTYQASALGSENATGSCLATATGAVLYYRATVPAHQTLAVRATPDSTMDAVVRILPACGATTCLASANTAGVGADESVQYANTGDMDLSVVIAVGSASNATNGRFDLEVFAFRSYTETTLPTACDTMMGASPVMGVGGDDSHSALLDMPFTFPFFGDNQMEYSVTSNGLIQLFPSLMGDGSNSYDNQPIPTAAEPNGLVAPLWDDLFPAMGSSVLARVVDTAPSRHLTIQWTGFTFYNDNTARLTFQVKLFERTGVIEFHYCSIMPGMNREFASGGGATVGVESNNGRAGRQHSHNMPMSVSTMTALRFTP